MRWSNLLREPAEAGPPQLPLGLPADVVRRVDTPGFAGMTFYEIQAKSIINRVPGASHVPFDWTINPYRGCSHACVYCFARNTHTYLDLDPGADFDRQVVVKVNAPELLRRELAAPSWRGAAIAMGTNVDCYQRAEGRYQLMRGVIGALRDFANPFSILTKGTLILRDLDLLRQAATVTTVGLAVSVGSVDEQLWRTVEPGTPSPRRRLEVVRRLTDAGFRVGVLMAPILPGLTDDPAQLEETVAAIAAAGAASLTPLPLHLRPGAREWYGQWLAREHPQLVQHYRDLYGKGSYAPQAYQREVTARVRQAARRHGIGRDDDPPAATAEHRRVDQPAPPPLVQQPTLW
ncbi:Rv2578c family radical SAM protein [Natronosporangium hydrolyticum]|uniref:Rv2578c family radical SAM protein n=1 Tax=Natronosporangium hydrolyticum TaxID=2811111 RepID=A0A895YHQ8_9ACTN|nr:Rv2578c family radical SAM protein [Natronosporangium hydrolyticum]QSB14076.1 Rv2578c family radical SAM protein [Natronosporangium hydrolyticum]